MASERTPLLPPSNSLGLTTSPPKDAGADGVPAAREYGAAPSRARDHHNLAGLPAWRFRLACGAVWSATFLAAFDGTVVATLLSDIGSSFNAFHLAGWLGTAYLLSLCCFTPVYGRLADALGRRNAQLTALAFFTVGTALCALAPDMNALIGARCLAGVGGGGLSSVGSILLSDLVDLRHRGLYQGYANIVFHDTVLDTVLTRQGLGASLGGPVGGWIADQAGWRVAFSAQLPFLLFSMAAVVMFVPAHLAGDNSGASTPTTSSSSPPPRLSWWDKLKRIDYLGSALLAVSVGALLFGFSLKTATRKGDGTEYAWSDPLIVGLLVLFALAAALFLAVEEWVAVEPVLPLAMLVRRTPAAVAVSNLTMAMAMFSLLYNVPIYFTAVRGQSAQAAGFHLLPYSVLIMFGSITVGHIMRRTGRYYPCMLVSGALTVLSTALLLLWGPRTPAWLTWLGPSPAGFGYSGMLTSTLVALMADVQRAGRGEIAVATSMSYMFRTVGQVLGVALGSALLQGTLQADLSAALPHDPELVDQIRRSTALIPQLPPPVRHVAVAAYGHGLHRVALVNFALACATTVAMACADDVYMAPAAVNGAEDEAPGAPGALGAPGGTAAR